jgi:hypothetical protein
MEETFSNDSPDLGDDELSPVEQTGDRQGEKPSWDSLVHVVHNRLSRRQHRPYPSPGYVEVFGNLPMSSAIRAGGYPQKVQIQQLCHFRIPIHLIQSLITYDDSALARVYTDYRDAARHMLASGVPNSEVVGPDFTAVDLFFRDRVASDPHTASFWACELCKTFGDAPVFVQLAGMYLLTYLMRVCYINKNIRTCHAHRLTFGLVDHFPNEGDIRQGAHDDQTNTESDARPTCTIHRSVRDVSSCGTELRL